MKISATLKNSQQKNDITVVTNSNGKTISIPGKPDGLGSSVNGGELLFLSLATCFCNDIYREAAKRRMIIDSVDVTVSGEFGNEGEPATKIDYAVDVKAAAHSANEINDLIQYVDTIAEIHNTLRRGIAVNKKS